MKKANAVEGDATRELLAALLMLGSSFTLEQFREVRKALGIEETHLTVNGLMNQKMNTMRRCITEKGKQYLLNDKEK